MNLKDAIQWFQIGDADYDSANILNNNVRKYNDIICYHCSQAVEKYLKGYVVYNDIVIQNTHNLPYLNSLCVEKDIRFQEISTECRLLNNYTNQIRYPHEMEITGNDVHNVLEAVKKIRCTKPLLDLRNTLINEIQDKKDAIKHEKMADTKSENKADGCIEQGRGKSSDPEWDR
jgi:HEPN domain-containing protein